MREESLAKRWGVSSHSPEYNRLMKQRHKDKSSVALAVYKKKMKKEALEILGNKCVVCGIDDIRVLCIDHINNDGRKDLIEKAGTVGIRRYIIKNPDKAKKKYQTLCRNCNWIKQIELYEQHKTRKYNLNTTT